VVITPNGRTLYTVNANDNTVTPIRVSTNTAGSAIPVGGFPNSAAITPDGKTLYVGNRNDATVTPIHVRTNTAAPPIPVGNNPAAIVVTPNGKTAYVSNCPPSALVRQIGWVEEGRISRGLHARCGLNALL
jgi:YVTN family beta-propeller protein